MDSDGATSTVGRRPLISGTSSVELVTPEAGPSFGPGSEYLEEETVARSVVVYANEVFPLSKYLCRTSVKQLPRNLTQTPPSPAQTDVVEVRFLRHFSE